MFDFREDPEETNLKLVNLMAACSYNDTPFDTSNRSANRTEPKREGFRRVFRRKQKESVSVYWCGIVDEHMKRFDFFLENGSRGLPPLICR